MATTTKNLESMQSELLARRDEWTARVRQLVEQISDWSRSAGWTVALHEEEIAEPLLDTYRADAARIVLPARDGEPGRALLVVPVGLYVVGGNGRVDLEGYPTLSRVKLIGVEGGWRIMTDSNVPLRQPWNAETFRQLAEDLVG